MVQLDLQLLYSARRLFDGANVHHLKELIFAYEQAVDLHNRRWPRHEIYQIKSEVQLRNYVLQSQAKILEERRACAVERARRAQAFFDERSEAA